MNTHNNERHPLGIFTRTHCDAKFLAREHTMAPGVSGCSQEAEPAEGRLGRPGREMLFLWSVKCHGVGSRDFPDEGRSLLPISPCVPRSQNPWPPYTRITFSAVFVPSRLAHCFRYNRQIPSQVSSTLACKPQDTVLSQWDQRPGGADGRAC